MSRYDRFFQSNQVAGGLGDIGNIFSISKLGRNHRQIGSGLSDVFKSIFLKLSPYLISAGNSIGQEFLRSGTELLSSTDKAPMQTLLKEQAKKSLKNLGVKAENKLKRMREPNIDQMGTGIKEKRE